MIKPAFQLSHFGFFVKDITPMEQFYTKILGFAVTDRGNLDGPNGTMTLVFMSKNPEEHHQIVLVSGRPDTTSFNPINQISLKGESLSQLIEIHKQLQDYGAEGIDPVTHGNALSVYVLDPEKNRIELFIDLPWYVDQPYRVSVDLSLPENEIMAKAEAHARTLPGFRPREQWVNEMSRLMYGEVSR